MVATAPANRTQTSPLVDELHAIRARASDLMARVASDEIFAWQPDQGRAWSVGQCLDHLVKTNRMYLASIRDALAHAPRASEAVTAPIRSTWIGRKFAAAMEPGTRKMPTLRKLQPQLATNRARVWSDFVRGLDEIEAVLRDAETIDLNRVTFASPFFKLSRVRAGTGFRILLAHARRHLQQAERVLDTRAASR
jgi:hypothetical protein